MRSPKEVNDERRQERNEQAPLLGEKKTTLSSTAHLGLGSKALAAFIVTIIVGTLSYELFKYAQQRKSAEKGVDLFADYERWHEDQPALPSQAPPNVNRKLPISPKHIAPQLAKLSTQSPQAPQNGAPAPMELKSGGLTASIDTQGAIWRSLGDLNGLQLGLAGQPLFHLLSSSNAGPSTFECKTVAQEQSQWQLRLRLSCSFNIEADFEINAPTDHDVQGYLRISVGLWMKQGTWPRRLSTLRLLQASLPPSAQFDFTGNTDVSGLPVILDRKLFVGGEHPSAITGKFASASEGFMQANSAADHVFVDINHLRLLPEPTETKPWRFGAVIGKIPEPSQWRRAFMTYLHGERPGRRTPMVHYNSWFDFYGWQDEGFFRDRADRKDTMTEESCIERVNEFGQHLVRDHGVKFDSFLIDDGWDNTETLWEFDKTRFPQGFTKLAEAAHEYGSGVGVWLSPWGGYGDSKKNRVEVAKARGLETHQDAWGEEAFELAGPKYKAWFLKTVLRMRQDQGVNMFKFDGVGSNPGEMEAMLGMLKDVRNVGVANRSLNEQDKLWISLTTGTWPSPFFLFWSDNIWRGDGDLGPAPGREPDDGLSQRQKWIRWRAEKVQEHVVKQSALFPLSQLMIHGVVLGGHGEALYEGLGTANNIEFAQEVWSFLGLGLQLQELYISPRRMTPSLWALLAEGLNWARTNSAVLMDTHWAFGDVSRREVFCAASWDPKQGKGFVLLQNAAANPQDSKPFSLSTVLELPSNQANQLLEVSLVKSIPGQKEEEPETGIFRVGAELEAERKAKAAEQQRPRLQSCKKRPDARCIIEAGSMTTTSLQHTEVLLLEVQLVK